MTSENMLVDYLTLSADEFADQVVIREEDIVQRYESEVKALKSGQERRAAHILIGLDTFSEKEAKSKIDEVATRIKAGEDFAELAKQFSTDPGTAASGGDLGMAPKGSYVEEFEAALYALVNKGDVSAPVLSEFGYHIIKLLDIAEAEIPTLASQRQRIKNALASFEAYSLFQQKMMELEDIIYESPDLEDAASLLGKTILTSQPFGRGEGEGIAAHANIRETAYGRSILIDRENSPLIELEDGKVVVLRQNTYNPAVLKNLDEVRNEVEIAVKAQLAGEKIAELRNAVIEMLSKGDSAAEVAKKTGADWISREAISRQQSDVPREVIQEAFSMHRPADGEISISSVSKRNGDISVLILSKVHDGFVEMDAEELRMQKQRLSQSSGMSAYTNYLEFLKEKAKIKYKQPTTELDS